MRNVVVAIEEGMKKSPRRTNKKMEKETNDTEENGWKIVIRKMNIFFLFFALGTFLTPTSSILQWIVIIYIVTYYLLKWIWSKMNLKDATTEDYLSY